MAPVGFVICLDYGFCGRLTFPLPVESKWQPLLQCHQTHRQLLVIIGSCGCYVKMAMKIMAFVGGDLMKLMRGRIDGNVTKTHTSVKHLTESFHFRNPSRDGFSIWVCK